MDRVRALAAPLVAAALASVVLMFQADLALHKPFWLDEGHEIVRTCERSAGELLLRGAHECSPAPLYWMAQATVVRNVEPVGLWLRVEYRAVSLAAAAFCLLVLLLALQGRLGLAAALIAPATLLSDPGFHFYAAQNRAYMFWVAVTVGLVVTAADVASRPQEQLRWALPALLGAGLLAGLTALPGCVQAAIAFAAVAAARTWTRPEGGLGRRQLGWLLAGALVILAFDVHYWRASPCRAYTGAQPYGLDVMLASDPARMVRHALTVLWPEGTSPAVLIGHGALLVGALTPLLLWRRRRDLSHPERYAFALSLVAAGQLLVAIPVAAGLLAGRYLFIPRMFIFAMVTRAALVALGFWWVARMVERTTAGRLGRWAQALPTLLAAIVTAATLVHGRQSARGFHLPLGPVPAADCALLHAPQLRLWEAEKRSPESTPNFLVRLGRALDACHASATIPLPSPRNVLVVETEAPTDWYRVLDRPPEGLKPLVVCGQPVVTEAGRVRAPF